MGFYSATLSGVTPVLVEIEIDLSGGLPFFQVVGLPDEILKESKTRVKSAISQSEFKFPYDKRLVMNLSPSKLKKEGSGFELGLAAQILYSSDQITAPDLNILFLGELALTGKVRPVDDLLALVQAAQYNSIIDLVVVPKEDMKILEKSYSGAALGIEHLNDFKNPVWWEDQQILSPPKIRSMTENEELEQDSFLCGQFSEFWAQHLKMAAVGKHHYLLCGPPGSGKTFFAESLRRLRSFEDYTPDIQLRVLNSLFERGDHELPWSAPHHSASLPGIVGGGNPPRPGAVTRAHGGILFLDELLEFSPPVLDSLREPLEKGSVEVARANHFVRFPSVFQLIVATNPCRCGHWKSDFGTCTCSFPSRTKYQMKLSGPLLDRFDVRIFCDVPRGTEKKVSGKKIYSELQEILEFKKRQGEFKLSLGALDYLDHHFGSTIKNHRQLKKIRAVGETLAALEFSAMIQRQHLERALEYQRPLF